MRAWRALIPFTRTKGLLAWNGFVLLDGVQIQVTFVHEMIKWTRDY